MRKRFTRYVGGWEKGLKHTCTTFFAQPWTWRRGAHARIKAMQKVSKTGRRRETAFGC